MMMTNGVGAWLGSIVSGWVIGKYFILPGGKAIGMVSGFLLPDMH
jgi:hypothetical protein